MKKFLHRIVQRTRGRDTIVGGNGNDAIFTGTGNNTIVMGAGANVIMGGVEVSSSYLPWSWSPATGFYNVFMGSAPYTAPTPYNGSAWANNGTAVPVGMGNDTIFGGKGILREAANNKKWRIAA